MRTAGRLVLYAGARQDARYELLRRVRGEPPLPDGDLHRVLVVCHGNICRSPFAAELLAKRLPSLDVRSAGLHAGDANPADPAAATCAARAGVSLAHHRSTRLDAEGLAWADLTLVMQGAHVSAIARGWPEARPRVRLLGDFLPAPPHLLDDPWGRPEEAFEDVFSRIREAVEALAMRIEGRSR